MNPFLDNYIQTLSFRQQVRVANILQTALSDQTQISNVLTSLTNFGGFVPLVLALESSQTAISSTGSSQNLRDINNNISDIYTYSALISLLLNSLNKQLGSQVKQLENQIETIESALTNYSFLSADNGKFAFGYLETFKDTSGEDNLPFQIPDRSVNAFTPDQQAFVNPTDHTLILTQNLAQTFPLSARIVKGNATAFVTSDSGIQNAVTGTTASGWRVTYAAPNPVTSTLLPGSSVGAQVLLEFGLNQSAYVSAIELYPFTDTAVEILDVRIFPSNDDGDFLEVLPSPITINTPFLVHFPAQSVLRFQVLLNQSTYTRDTTFINNGAQQYGHLLNAATQNSAPRRWSYKTFFTAYNKVKGTFVNGSLSRPSTYNTFIGVPIARVLQNTQTVLGSYQSWKRNPSNVESTINQAFLEQPGNYKKIFKTGIASYDFQQINQLPVVPTPIDPSPVSAMVSPGFTQQTGFDYKYDLGLQYVAIGYSATTTKGVFVSVPITPNGQVGVVKLKVSELNYIDAISDLDNPQLTSTEYSISNISNPQKESDWVPIIPVAAEDNIVTSERFFPDLAGRGFFRFSADRQKSIVLYKNGFILPITSSNYILDPSGNVVAGLNISSTLFDTTDILTVGYTTSSDFTSYTFPNLNRLAVTAVSDSQGAGEGFSGTGPRNSITLLNTPYIDFSQVATSTYNSQLGMTPYQPLTIILADGTTVINLTNYSNSFSNPFGMPVVGQQTSLTSVSTDGYYCIQSGNNLIGNAQIIFNKPISQPFRVYYQYLQGSVRFRAVLRVNSPKFVTPVVSSINLKAQIIKPDSGS